MQKLDQTAKGFVPGQPSQTELGRYFWRCIKLRFQKNDLFIYRYSCITCIENLIIYHYYSLMPLFRTLSPLIVSCLLILFNHFEILYFFIGMYRSTEHDFDWPKTESICSRQSRCDSKIEICFDKDRKHCGNRRKCWYPAFSSFRTMFSKAFFPRTLKTMGCLENQLHFLQHFCA